MKRLEWLLLCLCFLVVSCSSTTRNGAKRDKTEDENPGFLSLYKVEIDYGAVKKGAKLLFTEPPPGSEFGLRRRVQGVFSVSDQGFVRCDIKVAEPVMGLDGRRTEHVYSVLNFFGRVDETGTRATSSSGNATTTASGTVTEIRIAEAGKDKISIQAFNGTNPQPYLLHFHKHAVLDRDVPFPHE